ncbi:Sporulation initiation phosphotransferase F [Lacunisphaera limnophila]|uniref:Sporulation initiation phosphotransferase F n=1 Tax=Lacunisphaera limnophila TaxID=1838286 RepID=A0A1D8AWP8_9BACT|nr:response regulator [Lacunisphaera limnophila]AOS45315.1 Sporulation initiation phosphotransferase F [Lacunisphaera limnophila]
MPRPLILTIDDSKALRLFIAKALANFQCDTDEASNGFNAFFAIERARPDLILLDVLMPVMEGWETLRRLKAAPELADIPVIMLTSPADRPLIAELLTMGAAGTVMKPFNEAALLEAIKPVLKLKPAKR